MSGRRKKGQGRKGKIFSPDEIVERADEYLESYDLDLAAKFYQRALSADAANVRALQGLGSVFEAVGQPDQARLLFLRAVELEPESGYEKFMSLGQISSGHEAVHYYKKGIELIENEIRLLESAASEDSDPSEVPSRKSELVAGLCALAELYLTDLCFDDDAQQQCEAALKRALSIEPNDYNALQSMSSWLVSSKQPEQALAMLQRSVAQWKCLDELEQPSLQFRLETARLLLELGQPTDAVTILESAVEEDDLLPQTWYTLAVAQAQVQDHIKAHVAIHRACTLISNTDDADEQGVSLPAIQAMRDKIHQDALNAGISAEVLEQAVQNEMDNDEEWETDDDEDLAGDAEGSKMEESE